MDYTDALEAARSAWFSPEMCETFTYNGTDIYGHIEDDAFERVEHSVASVAFYIRIQKTDVAKPAVGEVVIHDGTQYRTGEGAYLSGGDWVVPLIRDYIEV